MTGTRDLDSADPVTEPEARAAYLAMEGRRSVERLHKNFTKGVKKTPSLRTLRSWSAKHNWVLWAKEHDEKVATGAAEVIARDATEKVITRAMQFDELPGNLRK